MRDCHIFDGLSRDALSGTPRCLLIVASAVLAFLFILKPLPIFADFELDPNAVLSGTYRGVLVEGGIDAQDFIDESSEWTIRFLLPINYTPNDDAYVFLHKLDDSGNYLSQTPIEGETYDFVRKNISQDSQDFSVAFPRMVIGSPDVLSGKYAIEVVWFPATADTYDPETDTWNSRPYEFSDYLHFIQFNTDDNVDKTLPDYSRSFVFEYIAATSTPSGFSNVAFFPGVQSSYLYRDGLLSEDQIWTPNVGIGADDDVEHMFMNEDGTSKEIGIYTKENDIILTAYESFISGVPVYAGLPEALDMLVSEDKIKEWKAIAYDWRLDIDTLLTSGKVTDEKLSFLSATDTPYIYQELHNLANSSDTGKVSIIAHSNGGLLAKALLADLEERNDPLFSKIDLVVLVAVPQLGTPKTLLPMLHGAENALSRFPIGLEDETWRHAVRYSPGAYNLLPSQKYFERTSTPVMTFTSSLDQLAATIQKRDREKYTGDGIVSVFDYRKSYGEDISSYLELQNFLQGNEGRKEPAYKDVQHPIILTPSLLADAGSIHERLDEWMPRDSDGDGKLDIRIVQVAGWGIGTISGVEYITKKNLYGCRRLIALTCETLYGVQATPRMTSLGDETVVLESATAMPVETLFFDIKSFNKNAGDDVERNHANMIGSSPVLNILKNVLTDESLDSIEYVSLNEPDSEELLTLEMHSPVSLEIRDEEGGRVGLSMDTSANAEYVMQTIPNTSYLEIGESVFISLTSQESYNVNLDGTATGTFTFKIKHIDDNEVVSAQSFTDIPVTNTLFGSVEVGSDITTNTLSIDSNGDGVVDKNISPDAIKKSLDQLFDDLGAAIQALNAPKSLKRSLEALAKTAERSIDKKRKFLSRGAIHTLEHLIKRSTKKGITQAESKLLLDILKEIEVALK